MFNKIKKYKIIISFIIIFIFLGYISIFTSGQTFDEFVFILGAKRILSGQIIYRDFYGMTTPGSYYLIAGIWKIFGQEYIYLRLASVLINFASCFFIYTIYKKFIGRFLAIINVLIFSSILLPVELNLYHHWTVLLLILMESYFLLKYIENKQRKDLIKAALALSVGFLFFHPRIIYLFIGHLIFLLYYRHKQNHFSDALKEMQPFIIWTALPILGIMAYFIYLAGWNSVFSDLITNNLIYYNKQNYLPLENNFLFIANLAGLLIITRFLYEKKLFKKPQITFLYLTTVITFISSLYRFDFEHQAYTYTIFMMLLISYFLKNINYSTKNIIYSIILLIPIICGIGLNRVSPYLNRQNWFKIENTDIGDIYLTKNRYPYTTTILSTIDQLNTKKIFIYPQLPLYYSLLDIENPSRLFMIYNNFNNENDLENLKNDLINKVDYIIYNPKERPYYLKSNLLPWIEKNFPYKYPLNYPSTTNYFYLYAKNPVDF